jgi:hypothetical protein
MFRQDSLDRSERPPMSKKQRKRQKRKAGPPAPRRPLNAPSGLPKWPDAFMVTKTGA